MNNKTPLVDNDYTIEKFQTKGGWTFVRIPEIKPNKNTPFGWVRVCGKIDDYEIKNYNLQSMGNGLLFLPIKAEIRKIIKKGSGDLVHITLYEDNSLTEIPNELILCLLDEPSAYENFLSYSEGEKKTYIDWIYAAKTDKTKVDRIVKLLKQINKNRN